MTRWLKSRASQSYGILRSINRQLCRCRSLLLQPPRFQPKMPLQEFAPATTGIPAEMPLDGVLAANQLNTRGNRENPQWNHHDWRRERHLVARWPFLEWNITSIPTGIPNRNAVGWRSRRQQPRYPPESQPVCRCRSAAVPRRSCNG